MVISEWVIMWVIGTAIPSVMILPSSIALWLTVKDYKYVRSNNLKDTRLQAAKWFAIISFAFWIQFIMHVLIGYIVAVLVNAHLVPGEFFDPEQARLGFIVIASLFVSNTVSAVCVVYGLYSYYIISRRDNDER